VRNVEAKWIPEGWTDHAMLVANVKLKLSKCKRIKSTQQRNAKVREEDLSQYQIAISNRFSALEDDKMTNTIDECWEMGRSAVILATEDVSKKRGRGVESEKMWLTKDTLSLVDKLEKQKSHSEKELKLSRKKIRERVKRDWEIKWAQKAEEMEKAAEKGDFRTLYAVARQHKEDKRKLVSQVRDEGGKLVLVGNHAQYG
jgi:hypothetical protein